MKSFLQKYSPAKWLICLVFLGFAIYFVVSAVSVKKPLPDYPPCHYSSYKDVLTDFDGVILSTCDKSDPEYYRLSNYMSSQDILVVEPTGKLKPQAFMAMQELKVIDVLQGDVTLKGQTISLMNPHLGSLSTEKLYGSYTNVLLPQERYIVFLQPLKRVNAYRSQKIFCYQLEPGAFNLNRDDTTCIDSELISHRIVTMPGQTSEKFKQTVIAYQDVKDQAYFVTDPAALQEIKTLRKDLLKHFNLG